MNEEERERKKLLPVAGVWQDLRYACRTTYPRWSNRREARNASAVANSPSFWSFH